MLPVALFDVKTLSAEQRASYSLLLPPRYRGALFGNDPYQISYAKIIAARLGSLEKPVGLILSSHYEGLGVGTLISIHIDPSFQDGIEAKALMELIETAYAKERVTLLDFFFRDSDPQQLFLRRFLSECEWQEPIPYLQQYFFEAYTFAPTWHVLSPKLSFDFEIFHWDTLKETDRTFIEKQYRQNRFNAHVYPFAEEELLENPLCFGLRYRGQVLGWSLVQKVAPDTVKYAVLYVDESLLPSKSPNALLSASIYAQQKSSFKWALFEYAIGAVPQSWEHFVEKRLKPYAFEADTVYRSWKFL